jgi:hypothetical protein
VITNDVWLGNLDLATGKVDQSTNGVINWQSSVPTTFPGSLYYAGKPAWYPANLNWPAFGSDVAGHTNLIPAQVRALALGISTTVPAQYTLGAAYTAGGTISVPGNGSYFNGAWVALSAKPDATHAFAGWSGSPVANSNSPTTWLVMPAANASVTANFVQGISYTLTVLNGAGSGTYVPGANVSISASAPAGQQFAYWTIAGMSVAATNSASTTFSMPAGNVTATAVFTTVSSSIPLLPPSNFHPQ